MTCIAGVEHNKKVYIGGDSAGTSELSITIRADEKVFINGPCIFGFTTSFRMGQILRYQLHIPNKPKKMSETVFVHTMLLESIRKTLKDFGYAKISENTEVGGTFLLGYAGHLYKVGSDYQVSRSVETFAACGCGEPYAIASLYTTKRSNLPTKRIQQALKVAEHFSVGVKGPFTILNL